MQFIFSSFIDISEDQETISIKSYKTGSTINLFEDLYISEFRNIQEAKGVQTIESELCKALYEEGMLIHSDESETEFFWDYVKNNDDHTLGLIILPTESCNLRCVYCYEDI
ncbi:MAG: hypothetical protein FWE34_04135 [Defluviitaleaceae bacterium]|nr:hypothetical protein [Defluviitaleaceae bacterium]